MNKNCRLLQEKLFVNLFFATSLSACSVIQPLNTYQNVHTQTIEISSTPSPAIIYIDGRLFAKTPTEIDLSVFQKRKYNISALPLYDNQYRQDLKLATGTLPSEILFYMDIPALEQTSLKEVAKVKTPLNETMIFPPVFYFEINQYTLTDIQIQQAEYFAKEVSKLEDIRIDIFGYADETGSLEYNQKLSLRRANEVLKTIQNIGVNQENINIFGLGEIDIINTDFTSISRQYNRKVNIEVIYNKSETPLSSETKGDELDQK